MTNVQARAQEMQSHWRGTGTPALVGHRENAVFRIVTDAGETLALRLHRNGYQTRAHIEGEMVWSEALANANFPCPKPVRTKDGELIVAFDDGQMATAVSWIEATHIGELQFSAKDQEQLYFDLGTLLERLHKVTDGLSIPVSRPSWDSNALLGDMPSWGRFWENPSLTSGEVATVLAARNDAKHHLETAGPFDMGLIHADAILENVLLGDALHLIDFDDSGYGYRLYELGVALTPHEDATELPRLTHAICDGYGVETDHMPLFTMLRGMASAGWIISRAKPDAEVHRRYADRMMRCISAYSRS